MLQGKATLLTTLADTIKAEKEQLEKKFAVDMESMKKELEEKTADNNGKGQLIDKVSTHFYGAT